MYELAVQNLQLDRLYSKIYYVSLLIVVLLTLFKSVSSDVFLSSRKKGDSVVVTALLAISIILFFGVRTLYGVYIGDTVTYYWTWQHNVDMSFHEVYGNREWIFIYLQIAVYRLIGHDISYFLLVVSLIYVGSHFIVCLKLMQKNIWVAFVFCIASFSFFEAGINGIRNGLACGLVMLGVIELCENKWNTILLAAFLFIIAYFIHISSALPSICAIVAYLFAKNSKWAIIFWLSSIIVSFLLGDAIIDWFADLGFDDRMDEYFINSDQVESTKLFSRTGFRWDFLLYSSIPVIVSWYVTIYRNFKDKTFIIIANTYILANSFWIMVIRAFYSNRFAYLSWFLYPIVIAYPLLRMNLWEDQNMKTALVLLLYSGFTFVMFL